MYLLEDLFAEYVHEGEACGGYQRAAEAGQVEGDLSNGGRRHTHH